MKSRIFTILGLFAFVGMSLVQAQATEHNNYNPTIDLAAQKINMYLLKYPSIEKPLLNAFEKKINQVYSAQKEKEIRLFSDISNKIHRTQYQSCLNNNQDQGSNMNGAITAENKKELTTYTKNTKKYNVKTTSCGILNGVSCNLGVFDRSLYEKGENYIKQFQELGISSIEDLSIPQLRDSHAFIASYDTFCQKNINRKHGVDSQARDTQKMIDAIKIINASGRSTVDASVFVSSIPNAIGLMDQKTYKDGKLLLVYGGNGGIGAKLLYVYKKGSSILVFRSENFSYRDSRQFTSDEEKYLIEVFTGKKQDKDFDKALANLMKGL